MSDRTAITDEEGNIKLIDVGQISEHCAERIVQAVGLIIQGADVEAANAFREIASILDGEDPEAEVERLRGASIKAEAVLTKLQQRHLPSLEETWDALIGLRQALAEIDALSGGGDDS